jgi:hypothetical protein
VLRPHCPCDHFTSDTSGSCVIRQRSGASPHCQRANDQLGCLGAREVLLTGNQVAVPDRETSPQPSLYIVGAEPLQFILDPPRHDVLVARQQVHAPNALSAKSSSTSCDSLTMSFHQLESFIKVVEASCFLSFGGVHIRAVRPLSSD